MSPGSGMSANGVGWTVAFRLIPGILQAVVKYSTLGSFVSWNLNCVGEA